MKLKNPLKALKHDMKEMSLVYVFLMLIIVTSLLTEFSWLAFIVLLLMLGLLCAPDEVWQYLNEL